MFPRKTWGALRAKRARPAPHATQAGHARVTRGATSTTARRQTVALFTPPFMRLPKPAAPLATAVSRRLVVSTLLGVAALPSLPFSPIPAGAATGAAGVQIFAVESAALDPRSHRALVFPNGLRVLLTSYPNAANAAASMNVQVGFMTDPAELPGLAHFCEHMLFLGSEKFPAESDFDSFCAQSAGYSNAWTSMDRTVYHFMLAHNQLYDGLDRFSGFFTSPLFTEDLTERELNAVDSENNKNLQEDSRREYQLWRSTAKPGHAVQRFGTGNKQSLWDTPLANGTNTRQHLLDFYKRCYSANIMKLAVIGREDLDTQERWVRQLFADVPNSDISPLQGVSPTDNAFDAGWKQIYRIVPVKERRKIVLYFPTASTYPSCPFTSSCLNCTILLRY